MKKEVLRRFISCFLAFFAAICIFLSGICLAVTVALSPSVILSLQTSEAFLDRAEEEILFELRSYAGPGGLPENFFDGGLDREVLLENSKRAVSAAYAGEKFKTEGFIDATRERIYTFAEGEQMNVELPEIKNGIEQLLNHFDSAYRNYIYSDVLRALCMVWGALSPWGFIASAVAAILAAVGVFFVLKITKARRLLFIGAVCGGATELLLLPLIILISGSVERIAISSPSIFYLFTSVIYIILFSLIFLSLLLAGGAVLLVFKRVIAEKEQ